MIDINFFMKAYNLKQDIMNGKLKGVPKDDVFAVIEGFRSQTPTVYNVETTNACNMRCQMCPRTTMMTRPIENISRETFIKVIDQLTPFPQDLWDSWEKFIEEQYGVKKNDVNENHFFLYIIPRVIQLHGYGDPLLDVNMEYYVKVLSERGFLSYFSCNPSNIDVDMSIRMFENGLNYIKYSIETIDDTLHRKIRGKASDFLGSYKKIEQLLEIKKAKKYKTIVVITMLNLGRKDQKGDYAQLQKKFESKDVYIYLKSEDQLWYRGEYHKTASIHWSEYCQHPWMSMTIKSNGEAAMCMEDFDNEIILGDAKKELLYDIWNGAKYQKLRKDHFDLTQSIKCDRRCDMKLIGNFL